MAAMEVLRLTSWATESWRFYSPKLGGTLCTTVALFSRSSWFTGLSSFLIWSNFWRQSSQRNSITWESNCYKASFSFSYSSELIVRVYSDWPTSFLKFLMVRVACWNWHLGVLILERSCLCVFYTDSGYLFSSSRSKDGEPISLFLISSYISSWVSVSDLAESMALMGSFLWFVNILEPSFKFYLKSYFSDLSSSSWYSTILSGLSNWSTMSSILAFASLFYRK